MLRGKEHGAGADAAVVKSVSPARDVSLVRERHLNRLPHDQPSNLKWFVKSRAVSCHRANGVRVRGARGWSRGTTHLLIHLLTKLILDSFGTSLEKLVFMPIFCKISSGT